MPANRPSYAFVKEWCPRQDHRCNGEFIPDRPIKQPDMGKCQYYDDIQGCTHPKHPKEAARRR